VALPKAIRRLTPPRLRDDVRLRALALAVGLVPPRTMHSEADVAVLLSAAAGARRAVEIGVYEGASAIALLGVLDASAELHLIDPFGSHSDALPPGWGASEHATRRTVERERARRGANVPRVIWHVARSAEVARQWRSEIDLVFIDGDHSREGCELDWELWSPLVARGGRVVFHDARADQPGGRGLPGPTSLVSELFRGPACVDWRISEEADRTVAVRRSTRSAGA
jgi:predicted O-methyltransferase YrrM